MEASSTMKSPVMKEKAARGQTIVTSGMPVRDSGGDAGKRPVMMKGSRDNLAHSISDGKVPSK